MGMSNSNDPRTEARKSCQEAKNSDAIANPQNGKRRGRPRVDIQDKTSADVSLPHTSISLNTFVTQGRKYTKTSIATANANQGRAESISLAQGFHYSLPSGQGVKAATDNDRNAAGLLPVQ